MTGKLGIIWEKLVHDLTLNERPLVLVGGDSNQFTDGHETPFEEEERLNTEI